MYANLNHHMIQALDERRAAATPTARPTRAAPSGGGLRLAVGATLVRAGLRLAPESASPKAMAGTSA